MESSKGAEQVRISIHAPREGGDYILHDSDVDADDFNPRPPRGGRHNMLSDRKDTEIISIHAPREGGDLVL